VNVPDAGRVCKPVDEWVEQAYTVGYWNGVSDSDANFNQCLAERAVEAQRYQEKMKAK
jgi:hypothetical protein